MARPVIVSVSPRIGDNSQNRTITLNGNNFEAGILVYIGLDAATDVVRSDDHVLTFTMPQNVLPQSYDITVVNPAGERFVFENGYRAVYPFPATSFTGESRQTISDRVLTELRGHGFDIYPGGFVYELVNAAAYEISQAYIRLDDVVRQLFPQTARSNYLNLIGESFGLPRSAAVTAMGTVRVTGTNGTVIPIGTRFATAPTTVGQDIASVFVDATEAVTVAGGTADVPVRAVLPGITGNVNAGQITRLFRTLSGVSSVTNPAALTGGVNIENDDTYRIRLLNFMRSPLGGGNVNDYAAWANEVEGVAHVRVVPLGRGNGTVDVYVSGNGFPYAVTGTKQYATLALTDQTISDGDTVTVGGTTYTFNTTLGGANSVLIETAPADTLANFTDAVGAVTGTSGTKYGTGTTANALVTCEANGLSLTFVSVADTDTTFDTAWTGISLYDGRAGSGTSPATSSHATADSASAELVTAVQNHIAPSTGAGLAPVGADVDVFSPDLDWLYISAEINVENTAEQADVLSAVGANIIAFVNGLSPGTDVKFIDVADQIYRTEGVSNYRNHRIYGGTSDVDVGNRKPYAYAVVVTAY